MIFSSMEGEISLNWGEVQKRKLNKENRKLQTFQWDTITTMQKPEPRPYLKKCGKEIYHYTIFPSLTKQRYECECTEKTFSSSLYHQANVWKPVYDFSFFFCEKICTNFLTKNHLLLKKLELHTLHINVILISKLLHTWQSKDELPCAIEV